MNKSYLKWAGGKQRIAGHIIREIKKFEPRVVVEPFVGAANIALNLPTVERIGWDSNQDLINVHHWVRSNPEALVHRIKALWNTGYFNDHYYTCRAEFNRAPKRDTLQQAALFIYLNKFGFNGLCRYNKSGGFNVPSGQPSSKGLPYFPEKEIYKAHNVYKNYADMEFVHGDFSDCFKSVEGLSGSVIYCDPPYVPLTTDFAYDANGFGLDRQTELVECAKNSRHPVLISNHWTPVTEELYKDATQIIELEVSRSISSKADGRKKIKEVIAIYN